MSGENNKGKHSASLFDINPLDSLLPPGMFSRGSGAQDVHESNIRKAKFGSSFKHETLVNKNLVGPIRPDKIDYSSSSSEDESSNILKSIRQLASATEVPKREPLPDEEEKNMDEGTENTTEKYNPSEPSIDDTNNEYLKSNNEQENTDDEDAEGDFDFKASGIPSSHEVVLKGHSKTITALALDQPGVRLASGSNDHGVRLWDFQGMNKNMNSFRILEPIPGNPILSLSFSSSNQEILVVAGSAQPKIISRDGKELSEFIKGDMYIKDMSNTRGHTTMVNDGSFHPSEKHLLATCSLDGTIRLWDRNMRLIGIEQQMGHRSIIKCKDDKGIKVNIYKMTYSPSGNLVLGICSDGSIQGFNTGGTFHRADIHIKNAHTANSEGTKLLFFKDGNKFISRSLDHSMKIWDVRQTKKPINVVYNLSSYLPGPKVCLSPDESMIVTGTSVGKAPDERVGYLYFYDTVTCEKKAHICMGEEGVTELLWHKELNQILAGCTDNSTHIFYDPTISKKGAVLCASKNPRTIHPEDMQTRVNIINPHALPLFKKNPEGNKRRHYERIRNDPVITRKPEIPLQGPGRGGKIGGASTVTQFIMRTVHQTVDKREDPQKALLKYAEEAEKNPEFVTRAYKNTQPVPLFDYSGNDIEEQKLLSSIQQICPGCGLKICKCNKSFMKQPYNK